MIKNISILTVILISLVGCSNLNITEITEMTDSNTDSNFLTSEEAESKVKWLIYFGNLDDGNSYDSEEAFNNLKLNIESQQDSYVITLDNNMILTMDKETGIIYCIENQGQKMCDEGYITYLEGGIIFDTDSFSCVPGEPKAAADDSGMKCHQEIIDNYKSLKEKLVSKR